MIKKIAKYVGEYKKAAILSPVFIILEVIADIIIPYLMASMIDIGVGSGNMEYVYKSGLLMVGVSMIALLFGVLSGRYAARASSGFAGNLRQGIYYNIQEFSFANTDKYSTSGLITRLTTDVTNVQNAFQMIIRVAVRAPIMLVASMIMSFYISRQAALIFLGTITFLGFALYWIIMHAHPNFVKVFEKYDALNASVQENLTGIRFVKAYVREEHEIKKFKNASEVIYQYFLKALNYVIFNAPVMQFAMYSSVLLLSWLGAKQIVSNTMTTGELMILFTYSAIILNSLMMLSMIFVMMILARPAMERIVEVLDEKSDLTNGTNPVYEVKDGSVVFEHVNFSYAGKEDNLNLEDINLTIHSGETIGIIGGTGSAKTTFVQLIPRLYDVTGGSIKIGGVDVRDYDLKTLRDQVSMVLQKNVLFSGTIKENLRWGNKYASEEEIIEACRLSQASEFIDTFPQKYDTYIEQGGTNVSGGQKQRLTIARALLKKPKILILDDSTSAVDTKTDALIQKAMKETIPETTKIIIAQRISSVQEADKIIVLDDGRIHGFGTHEELLKNNDIYKEVFESQGKGADADEE
jgi:ATP-binding cassette subfamily B protein